MKISLRFAYIRSSKAEITPRGNCRVAANRNALSARLNREGKTATKTGTTRRSNGEQWTGGRWQNDPIFTVSSRSATQLQLAATAIFLRSRLSFRNRVADIVIISPKPPCVAKKADRFLPLISVKNYICEHSRQSLGAENIRISNAEIFF